MQSAINWFEIPVNDFARAKKFYETILSISLNEIPFGEDKMGFFPAGEGGVGGAITLTKNAKPSADGTVVYLNAQNEQGVEAALGRVEKAGGRIVLPKMAIPPHGFIGWFLDTEGNRVGLHGM